MTENKSNVKETLNDCIGHLGSIEDLLYLYHSNKGLIETDEDRRIFLQDYTAVTDAIERIVTLAKKQLENAFKVIIDKEDAE